MERVNEGSRSDARLRKRSKPPKAGVASRQACLQCRHHQLRCDGMTPRCSRCVHAESGCQYAPLTPSTSIHCSSSSPQSESSLQESEAEAQRACILDQLWELDVPRRDFISPVYKQEDNRVILDHFRECDDHWLGSPSRQSVFQTHGLRLAMDAPYLMYAIMAFSASHLYHCNPQEKKYDIAHLVHYTLSLQNFTIQLNKPVTAQNIDAILACAFIHADLAFWKQGQAPADADPFQWLRTCHGVAVLIAEHAESLKKGVWKDTLTLGGGIHVDPSKIYLTSLQDPVIEPWVRDVIERFEELYKVSLSDDKSTSVYTPPLRHLSKIMRTNVSHRSSGATMRFNGSLTPAYVKLLEEGDPRAMLIFCYWYGLMCNVKQWWAETEALKGCRWLCEQLTHCPDPRVQYLLQWPMTQAGLISQPAEP